MSEQSEQPNPANPICPVCGAADWFLDTRWNYVLHAVYGGTQRAVMEGDSPMVIPCEGAICRSCRFIRLRSLAGTLDMEREPPENAS